MADIAASPPIRLSVSKTAWVMLLVVLGVVVVAAVYAQRLAFAEVTTAKIVALLTPLFVIAAFLERASEVFVTAWRGSGRDLLEAELSSINLKLSEAADEATKALLRQARRETERALVEYKCTTRAVALWANLSAGLIIGAVGIQGLGDLVVADPAKGLPVEGFQRNAFVFVDIAVTGALIGGGAEGIHKLVSVVTDFLDKTRKNISG